METTNLYYSIQPCPTWCLRKSPTLLRTTFWERELLATNGGIPILTPMITDPIYWLSHCYMVRRKRKFSWYYCITYEFGDQQGRSNPRGIWTLLDVAEQQGRSNPHGIWILFAVVEYASWLTYTQFSGCVPLIWGECFDVIVGMCESTHRSCELTISSCESTLSMPTITSKHSPQISGTHPLNWV